MQPIIINERYVLSKKPHSAGGMAEIYSAIDQENDQKRVAVKLFKHGIIKDEVLAESFRRETKALEELEHPNIVKLFDAGIDKNTEHYFLVLEWMEKDLSTFLKESPSTEWDSFWKRIACPLLEAMAFSHARTCVHRDIGPSNILIDSEGKPRLADFGISKIKRFFQPTITLMQYGHPPFTPKEEDDGSYSYTRDVFSFGVVVLKSLTKVNLTDYDDIPKALAELNAPEKVIKIIEQTVLNNPEDRQKNAEVLLAQLKAVQDQRSEITKQYTCYLKLTTTVLNNLQNVLHASEDEIETIISDDLNAVCGIEVYRKAKADEFQYRISGANYSYHVTVDSRTSSYLVILNASSSSNALLEKNREYAWIPPYQFKIGKPLSISEGEDVIRNLQNEVETNDANLKYKKADAEKQRLFRTWGDILRAKLDWEKNREKPLKYTKVNVDKNRAIFQLSELPEEDIAGQPRHVTTGDKGFSLIRGDVQEVNKENKTLILYIKNINTDEPLPQKGSLLFDVKAAEIALSRQKIALDAIKFDRAVRDDLRLLLVEPQKVATPTTVEDIQFVQQLDESQQEVVQTALGTQDFLIVQGPPGTGKTRMITEVILKTLQKNPETRILLSSQTHVALDNALERIQENRDLKLVRIGNHEKVAENIHVLMLDEQRHQWQKQAVENGEKFLTEWATQQSLSQQDIENTKVAILWLQVKELSSKIVTLTEKVAEQEKLLNAIRPQSGKSKRKAKFPPETVLKIQSLEKEIADLKKEASSSKKERTESYETLGIKGKKRGQFTLETIEGEINKLIDLSDPKMKMLQQLLSLQVEWFEQFGRSEKFNVPLLKRAQVVAGTCIGIPKEIQDIDFDLCIVDEASKATATEVLVPISRARRWILVGDPKQLPPFKDEASKDAGFLSRYELEQSDIETLFDYLLKKLPESHSKMLKIQHRMVKPIGDLISECFYEGELQSSKSDTDKTLLEILPQPVTWLTTTRLSNRNEQAVNKADGKTYNNACEVNIIVQLLKQLNQVAVKAGKRYSVAILTGYSAQVSLINRKLDAEIKNGQALTIECNTVDAFQGREANIVIYSVTRSNKEGKVGFLRDVERLNVALSRGQVGLVIVGDHFFCRTLPLENPLHKVLNYIENHPKNCNVKETQ
ncbi:AAA domain-containing protein [Candidatus Parabeggiatoa sp. HSG14]|uniref:AAA domain-containing protein n=1 Tax=Candidatus Parabeggiatoa sp. HSG14 TaxID=3055593 RepID=UPI0025A80A8A|nr:AAA domain-containing protein [Thiotrichales bacterium HSG14]